MENKREMYNKLCDEYRIGVSRLCTCNTLFVKCTCNAEKRYKDETGNVLFKEDDYLHNYVRVGEESCYAALDSADAGKDVFISRD